LLKCACHWKVILSVSMDSTESGSQLCLAFFWGPTTLFMGPPNSTKCAYPCIFGSHSTIHTFNNYFITVFSAISFQFSANKRYSNRPLVTPRAWRMVLLPLTFIMGSTH